MKKHISLIALSLLVLAGCESIDPTSGSGSSTAGSGVASSTPIKKIQFNLPEQIKWDTVQQGNGSATIYTPKGVDPKKSPIKFVYQFVKHDKNPDVLAQQIIKPIQTNCEKPASNTFKTRSQYPNQISYQTLCNKFNGASFGMVNYLDIFTDATGSHVLIGEIKTPASAEPGKLDTPQTDADKKAAQNTIAFIKLAQKTMTEVAACDASGQCL